MTNSWLGEKLPDGNIIDKDTKNHCKNLEDFYVKLF